VLPLLSFQAILATIKAFDLKLLSWLNTVLLPDLSRNDDLALRGNRGPHESKIASY
jgi:hypothetical protein